MYMYGINLLCSLVQSDQGMLLLFIVQTSVQFVAVFLPKEPSNLMT